MNFHFVTEPETVRRLRLLKPGETLRFYRGNRSDAEPNGLTPNYSTLLKLIFQTAEDMEKKGLLELAQDKHCIELKMRRRCSDDYYITKFSVTDFLATRLQKETAAPGSGLRR